MLFDYLQFPNREGRSAAGAGLVPIVADMLQREPRIALLRQDLCLDGIEPSVVVSSVHKRSHCVRWQRLTLLAWD